MSTFGVTAIRTILSTLDPRTYLRGEQSIWRAVVICWLLGTAAAAVLYYQFEKALNDDQWLDWHPLARCVAVALVAAWVGVVAVAKCSVNAPPKIGGAFLAVVAMITVGITVRWLPFALTVLSVGW